MTLMPKRGSFANLAVFFCFFIFVATPADPRQVSKYLGSFEPIYEFTGLQPWKAEEFNSDSMKSGDTLVARSGLESPNGLYKFIVQEDANLVIYDSV